VHENKIMKAWHVISVSVWRVLQGLFKTGESQNTSAISHWRETLHVWISWL